MIGEPGEKYCGAKVFDQSVRYLADWDSFMVKLTWSTDRGQAKPMEYREVTRLAKLIPGLFVARACVAPPAQQELSLW